LLNLTIAAMSTPNFLRLDVLTAEAFAPYGDVIEANASGAHFTINAGFAQRFHNLATVDVARAGGTPIMSIVRAKPRQFPLQLQLLERHPLGSQAFVALAATPFMVVVAPPANQPQMEHLRCFRARRQLRPGHLAPPTHRPACKRRLFGGRSRWCSGRCQLRRIFIG
jgi:hypothetical protein